MVTMINTWQGTKPRCQLRDEPVISNLNTQHNNKELRSHKIQLQWAKIAVGPWGDGFSVFKPHWHSIMESQKEYSKATAQNNSYQLGVEQQNEKRGADNADLPRWDITTTPRRASSGTTQPHGTCSLPHCIENICVTFTHSAHKWVKEAVVRFIVPYLCVARDNMPLWQTHQGRSNASRATPPELHHANTHCTIPGHSHHRGRVEQRKERTRQL